MKIKSFIRYALPRTSKKPPKGGRMTTQAVGEEGGTKPPNGGTRPPKDDGRMTTLAVGEEGGTKPSTGDGRMTTLAVGEEGGQPPDAFDPSPKTGKCCC